MKSIDSELKGKYKLNSRGRKVLKTKWPEVRTCMRWVFYGDTTAIVPNLYIKKSHETLIPAKIIKFTYKNGKRRIVIEIEGGK